MPVSILAGVHAPDWLFAHLSDPHVSTPAAPQGRERWGKRAFGYRSWQRRRRHVHRREVLDALAADLRTHAPRAVLITGDFTQTAQPDEFAQVAAWLATLGPGTVLGVPGNHDAYVPGAWSQAGLAPWVPAGAPWVRTVGPARVFGVSSAVPTGVLSARGVVDDAQCRALAGGLREAAGALRVVLIHHPPLDGTVRWRKALAHAGAVRTALAAGGAHLVLHGHGHARELGWLDVNGAARARVSGVPSASSIHPHPRRRAAYDLYAVRAGTAAGTAGPGWDVECATREWDGKGFAWGPRTALKFDGDTRAAPGHEPSHAPTHDPTRRSAEDPARE